MPVLTTTGSWQITECPHCQKLIAAKSKDPDDVMKLLKAHWQESVFCGIRQGNSLNDLFDFSDECLSTLKDNIHPLPAPPSSKNK